jgi:superfamily II DNA or RNA helicase
MTFVLQCRSCLGAAREKDQLAPNHGRCSECKEPGPLSHPLRERLTARQEHQHREENDGADPITHVDRSIVNAAENVMFRCTLCERAWHMRHLPPKIPARAVADIGDEDDEDVETKSFREYSRRWKCNECANEPGEIDVLIAWRPVDMDAFVPGTSSDMLEEDSKEYLVKWRKLSHFQTQWMPGAWVWGRAQHAMRRAFQNSKKNEKPLLTKEDAIPEEFLHVDIVFDVEYTNVVSNSNQEIDIARIKEVKSVYAKYKGLPYEDTVWEKPPSATDTEKWKSFEAAYEDWVKGKYLHVPRSSSLKKHLVSVRTRDFAKKLVKHEQPKMLTGGVLMNYQKEGLNWIYYKWFKQQNAILADEMGLGKTIQLISFFATLVEDHNCFPFLVVVPNSTCQNWRSEIKTWAPKLRVVTYYGSATARKLTQKYEMFSGSGSASSLSAHIIVTSYETMMDDAAKRMFSSIPWAALVVDEGHRLKNDRNQIYGALSKIKFPFKILLTGTPLQNNVRELFNILQFVDPSKNAQELEEQFSDLTKESVIEVHEMIRPFFLRRTKAQVLNFLPPMAQVIVPVSMTVVQKKLYKSILSKNPQLIKAIFKSNESSLKQSERHNLNNILMQLRKVLCHPFVYSKAIEEREVSVTLLYRNLVEASVKLQLLELLLPKLQERGHRVLIFSQFLEFLDIIEDFLDGLGLQHLRLDGSLDSLKKQKIINDYNAPDSPYFAFLLSTRAGGVGINLATADTVIIMDPDFNPHQDIQALSRAHRIGQLNKVLVFQLMTKHSAEEKIMQAGRKKMALDHVLIERMDAEDDAVEDLESILRFGAVALFDDDNSGDIHYDAQSIEKLLDRSQAETTQTDADGSAESQFSFARVWANDSATMEAPVDASETTTPDPSLWEKILQQRERAAEEEARAKAETLGRGKRRRQVRKKRVLPGFAVEGSG